MKKFLIFTSLFLSSLCLFCAVNPAYANNTEEFSVGKTLGDGKNGNPWYQWRQTINEKPVSKVVATLRKKSGGSNTYVNLRFGSKGAFENGKRVTLHDGAPVTATWNVGGENPRGQKLVMNVYGGEAYLDNVRVEYIGPISKKGADSHFGETGKRRVNKRINRGGDSEIARRCDRKRNLRYPEIEVDDVDSSGGLFSGKYKIKGSILAACVEEAGYYEKGQLKESFNFPFSDRYKRTNFRIKVRSGKKGEIRVLSYDGSEERVYVDDIVKSGSRTRNNNNSAVDNFPFNLNN